MIMLFTINVSYEVIGDHNASCLLKINMICFKH